MSLVCCVQLDVLVAVYILIIAVRIQSTLVVSYSGDYFVGQFLLIIMASGMQFNMCPEYFFVICQCIRIEHPPLSFVCNLDNFYVPNCLIFGCNSSFLFPLNRKCTKYQICISCSQSYSQCTYCAEQTSPLSYRALLSFSQQQACLTCSSMYILESIYEWGLTPHILQSVK